MRNVLVLLSSLALAAVAGADQIVHAFSVTGGDGDVYQDYDAFAPGLGTLTSVVMDLRVVNSGTFTILNRGPAATVHLNLWNHARLYAYRTNLDGGGLDFFAGSVGGVYRGGYKNLAMGESVTVGLNYAGGVTGDFYYDADGNYHSHDGYGGLFEGEGLEGFVARYTGDKTTFRISDLPTYEIEGLDRWTISQDFAGHLDATVTYNYTPVPEPASLAVLGLGALRFLRRRRA